LKIATLYGNQNAYKVFLSTSLVDTIIHGPNRGLGIYNVYFKLQNNRLQNNRFNYQPKKVAKPIPTPPI
jgi:hypothetical protein